MLDKPAGLPCHAGPRGGPSVEDWFPRLSRRRDGPWLAHRLDADTSGVLVIALRRAALHAAQALFAAGGVDKTYWAVVDGAPPGTEGRIENRLARRSTAAAGWRMIAAADGQAATTDWRLLARDGAASLLQLHPRTGRTHQIRVHCAALGCPVAGDPVYGRGPADHRLQLLARRIVMTLPSALAIPALDVTAPPASDMHPLLVRAAGRT